MTRNYTIPVSNEAARAWGEPRETHVAVAMAIHSIADTKRLPEEIWEEPTGAEKDHVRMAVQEYVDHGVFPAEDDGLYAWGSWDFVTIEEPRNGDDEDHNQEDDEDDNGQEEDEEMSPIERHVYG